MTRTGTRDTSTLERNDLTTAGGLVALPDEPGEVVFRGLLVHDEAVIEVGVTDRADPSVYVVTVEHCTHLSPAEARAAAGHLLRAADEAETRDR